MLQLGHLSPSVVTPGHLRDLLLKNRAVFFSSILQMNLIEGPNILSDADVPVTKRSYQGGGSVIIWAGIVNQIFIDAFKVDEGVTRSTVQTVTIHGRGFLSMVQDNHLVVKCVFIHDNTSSRVSKFSRLFCWCEKVSSKEEKGVTTIKSQSENLWSVMKTKFCGKQYDSKTISWEAIKTTMSEIETVVVMDLTKSIDNKLLAVIEMKDILRCKCFKDVYICYFFCYRC